MGGHVERRRATLGLLISAGCVCLFVAIAVGVLTGGPLARFDRWVADALHAHASGAPGLTEAVRVVVAPGSMVALALVSVAVAVALLAQRRWSALVAWLVAVLGGEALNLLLKDLFARPRPRFERPLVVETSYSFPSGQAMESLVVYGMLAYFAVLILSGSGKRVAVAVGAAVLVVLIGFGRAYLGAHYLSDVVGGFVAGGAWLGAVIAGREAMRGRGSEGRGGQASPR
jgi:membrane-associated phospholipid phosphatase